MDGSLQYDLCCILCRCKLKQEPYVLVAAYLPLNCAGFDSELISKREIKKIEAANLMVKLLHLSFCSQAEFHFYVC